MTGALILQDGDRTLDLVGTGPNGIWVNGPWTPPLPVRELTYAESSDSLGRRRLRDKEQNGEGSIPVTVAGDTPAVFWDHVDDLQEMVESCHANKGSLRYEPLRDGQPVTFDLESITITGLPQDGVLHSRLICEAEITFESLPGGRLDPVTIFTAQALAGPIASVEIPNVPGHLDAWVELILTDTSSQSRQHLEVAIQDNYDPGAPEPLLLNLASGLTVTGFAGTSSTLGGSYATNVANATVTTTPVVVCGTTAQAHRDRWKVRCRVYSIVAGARARLAWKVGDGPISRERWVNLPGALNWYDLDLETINIEELETGHSWTGYIEAYTTGSPTSFYVDTVFLVPA